MLSEKALRTELKRFPGFIRRALKDEDYEHLLVLHHQQNTIEWILSDED